VSIVDEAIRENLSREIYERRRSEVGSTTANTRAEDTDDEDLIGYDPIEPGLPPASSDKRKWWLDNGRPARSDIKPPQNGAVPNPNRSSNPFTYTDEPDWVTVPRMPPRNNSQTNVRPSTNGTRQLPPPFNQSAISSLTNNLSQTSLDGSASTIKTATQTMPSTTDRRLSTSTTSSTSKKPPPVARKPVHLSSSPSLTTSPTLPNSSLSTSRAPQTVQKPRQRTADHTGFAPPPRRMTAASPVIGSNYGLDKREVSTPPPPPQPRRAGASKQSFPNEDFEGPKPGLPPRPPANIMDDEDGEMNGWEALKPS